MLAQPTTAGVYTQFSGLAEMKHLAKQAPEQALQKVAKQFEGLFLQMMLKSMRDASFGNPLFDNDSTGLYQDMFDKQIALSMSEQKGIGLAEALVRQLRAYVPQQAETTEHAEQGTSAQAAVTASILPQLNQQRQTLAAPAIPAQEPNRFDSPRQFVESLWPHAKQAAAELGTEPEVLLAQAALETGWGSAISQDKDGHSSYNLFNIKADSRWQGRSVVVNTLEFEGGMARRQQASFRAYDSYAESFQDYVAFLKSNPRYQQALQAEAPEQYVRELHAAGYATDPRYADKILNIMERDSFRQQLQQVQGDAIA